MFTNLKEQYRKLPLNFGPLKGANGSARITGPCGDTMEFWVYIDDDKICAASYTTDGCEHSIQCGFIAAYMAEGVTVDNVYRFEQNDILCMAKDIPEESKHCALLAVNTLKAAVGDYQERNKKQNECNSPDEDCSKCDKEECASRKTESSFIEKDENLQLRRRLEKIKNKILVLSGKGGVGKSTMAVNIASVLASEGKKVGILDVDIHGPSIPMMLGVDKLTPMTDGEDILPVTDGVLKIMSIGFFLRSNDDPVIWRGPMKMNMIKQFLKDVRWGDIDYLVIDCPPGTGDEPLSVCQLIEAPSGAIIVTTPQNVAINDVRKSINFCHSLQLKILGVIENMSGFKCPNCGEVSNIFKEGGAEKMASDFKVPFLGRIPIEGEIVISGDSGKSLMNKVSASTAEELKKIVSQIISKTN